MRPGAPRHRLDHERRRPGRRKRQARPVGSPGRWPMCSRSSSNGIGQTLGAGFRALPESPPSRYGMLWLVDPGNPAHAGLPRSREGIPGGPGARGRSPGGGLDASGEGAGSACRPVGRRVCGSGEVSRDRSLRGSAGARGAARARGNRAVGVAKRTPSRHPCPPQGAAVVDRRYPATSPPPSPAGTVRKFGRGGAVAVALIVLSIAGRGGRKWSTVSGPVSSDGPLPPRRGNRPTSGSNQGIPNGHGTRTGPQSTALARLRRPYTTPPTPSWKIGSCRTGPRGWGRGRFRPGAPSNRQGREPCDKQDMPT